MGQDPQTAGGLGAVTPSESKVPSVIVWSIVLQILLFLAVRAARFFPTIDPANYISLTTLQEFFEEAIWGTLWVVAFQEMFKWQFLLYALLSIALVAFLIRACFQNRRCLYVGLFNVTAVTLTLIPELAIRFGDYRGP